MNIVTNINDLNIRMTDEFSGITRGTQSVHPGHFKSGVCCVFKKVEKSLLDVTLTELPS